MCVIMFFYSKYHQSRNHPLRRRAKLSMQEGLFLVKWGLQVCLCQYSIRFWAIWIIIMHLYSSNGVERSFENMWVPEIFNFQSREPNILWVRLISLSWLCDWDMLSWLYPYQLCQYDRLNNRLYRSYKVPMHGWVCFQFVWCSRFRPYFRGLCERLPQCQRHLRWSLQYWFMQVRGKYQME